MKTIYMNHTLKFMHERGIDVELGIGVKVEQKEEYIVITEN